MFVPDSLRVVPWREMSRLQDEMNRLLSTVARPPVDAFPPVNVWTGEEGAIVTTELPGVELNDLDISVVGDTLTIRGSRPAQQTGQGTTYHRRERGFGRFTRTLQLPFRVEPNDVGATMKNGILVITLPRAHADRPRKIEIKTA